MAEAFIEYDKLEESVKEQEWLLWINHNEAQRDYDEYLNEKIDSKIKEISQGDEKVATKISNIVEGLDEVGKETFVKLDENLSKDFLKLIKTFSFTIASILTAVALNSTPANADYNPPYEQMMTSCDYNKNGDIETPKEEYCFKTVEKQYEKKYTGDTTQNIQNNKRDIEEMDKKIVKLDAEIIKLQYAIKSNYREISKLKLQLQNGLDEEAKLKKEIQRKRNDIAEMRMLISRMQKIKENLA